MNTLLLLTIIILLIINIVANIIIILKKNDKNKDIIEHNEKLIKDEFQRNRKEYNEISQSNRQELSNSLNNFGNQFSNNVKELNKTFTENFKILMTQQKDFNQQLIDNDKRNREKLNKSLKSFEERFDKNINLLSQKFNDINSSVEKQLKEIRNDNTTQLEKMRNTVEEKLQRTLNERLSHSFETVSKQLQSVQVGLGEMKKLANDVGGLKKVLSNVKMRGSIGEIQLEMLLEQILAPNQYEANVKTKKTSSDLVEFAIKLPGKDDKNSTVWLPIDAKFPKDIYEQLVNAYETGETDKINIAKKNMENTIKKMAKDISEKYIDPPNTTDFGIMFLPFEGIYAEVVRNATLLESLHRDYKIVITGPTTLAAILNSLQIGFKTLAIQKRSSEVWKILGAVKQEFGKFGNLLQKAKENIQTGLDKLDDVMGKRTDAIQRKLKNVELLSEDETKKILPEIYNDFKELEKND